MKYFDGKDFVSEFALLSTKFMNGRKFQKFLRKMNIEQKILDQKGICNILMILNLFLSFLSWLCCRQHAFINDRIFILSWKKKFLCSNRFYVGFVFRIKHRISSFLLIGT